MLQVEWLSIIMQSSYYEIYVLDCATLQFLQANEAACTNLQYSAHELAGLTLFNVMADLTPETFEHIAQPLRDRKTTQACFEKTHVRKDGTSYPIQLRFFNSPEKSSSALIAIGTDRSSESAKALKLSESRFHTIASSAPGLVYQFLRRHNGDISFPYLSKGCRSLLGIPANQLRANPGLLFDLIIYEEDRQSYISTMKASAAEMKSWNWEGRIWINEWKDIKWINLRATPHDLGEEGVQWVGIMTNITHSKLQEAEIKSSRAQLAELSAHVETVKEQERMRIAREIHDDLGGNLTAIKMALALLTRRLPAKDASLIEKAAYIDSLVDRTIETVHRIAGDLRPGVLDFGLVAALDWQAGEFEKQLGVPCEFSSSTAEIELDPDQATALFRIVQEALANISKHAGASKVDLRLIDSKHSLLLEIEDNGCGIETTDFRKPKSYGIRGMKERATALGGDLSITAGPSGGSIVSIKIPLAAA